MFWVKKIFVLYLWQKQFSRISIHSSITSHGLQIFSEELKYHFWQYGNISSILAHQITFDVSRRCLSRSQDYITHSSLLQSNSLIDFPSEYYIIVKTITIYIIIINRRSLSRPGVGIRCFRFSRLKGCESMKLMHCVNSLKFSGGWGESIHLDIK